MRLLSICIIIPSTTYAAVPQCNFPTSLPPGSTAGQLMPPTDPSNNTVVQGWLDELVAWRKACTGALGYNGSVYDLEALKWTQSSYIQPQIHPCNSM